MAVQQPSILMLLIFLGGFIGLVVGIIILQIFLSKKENKWPGLILPIISAIFSIWPLLLIPVSFNESIVQSLILVIMLVLLCNIPTAILIAIYFACRQKFKKKKEIDKMNIQDL